jgi:hypothetical protein
MRNSYEPEQMIAELRAKGLYRSSPMETHCTLFPLLNYYSFKHWDCMFYKLNASTQQRVRTRGRTDPASARTTFSIAFPEDLDLLDVEGRLRRVTLEIAAKAGDPGSQREELVAVFRALGADEQAAGFVADSFLQMPSLASSMGIRLS